MVTLGIIGYGYWGPNLVRNFYALENVHLKWVCDLREENLKSVRSYYPTIRTSRNFTELLNDLDIDAIVIATPVDTHYKLAHAALTAGKHVLVEKPITGNSKDAKKLIALAKSKRRLLMVDHTFIYTGAVQKMKHLIDAGNIGNLLYFDSVRINLGLIRHDINVIWDLAPHDLAIMMYLMKKRPISVQAMGVCQVGNRLEELAYITIRFPKNVTGHIHVSWLSPVKVRNILVGGSKQMIMYNDVEPTEKIKLYDKGVQITPSMKRGETPFTPVYRAGDILIPRLDPTEPLAAECAHFVDCIMRHKRPLTDGESGLAVVELLEACDRSLRSRSKEIFLS